MSRDLTTANLAAASADLIIPVLFAYLDFASGIVRVHSRLGTISWGGDDWTGVGTFGAVSSVEESSDLSRRTVTYTLAGIPGDYVSVVLDEHYQGRTARLYVGFLDTTTNQLIDTPELLDQGRMDLSEIDEGKNCSVTITAESRFSAWDRALVRRYTNADQQSRFPGDKGLEFVDQAAQKEVVWGRAA